MIGEGSGKGTGADGEQFGGSPIKVGEEEYSLFRDHEYVQPIFSSYPKILTGQ